MIMEYLLINHPLDCPVCDQAGECGLQDYSYEYGQANHRFVEERTVNPRKDVSDLIQLNQDRCIMCTRCVRFTREITQTGELQVMRRGQPRRDRHLPRPPGRQPPGRQRRRPLPGRRPARQGLPPQAARLVPLQARRDLHPLLDRLQHQGRGEPRRALAVQAPVQPARQRLLDLRRGPVQLQGRQRPGLLSALYYARQAGDLGPVADRPGPQRASARASARSPRGRQRSPAILSPFLTVEEAYLLASLPQGAEPGERPGPRARSRLAARTQTFTPDQTKGRTGDTSFVVPRPFTIHAEKCPNRKGVEAVLEHFQGEVIDFEAIARRVAAGEFQGLYVASDAIDAWIDEAEAKALRGGVEFLVVQDTTVTPLAQLADAVLAGATFAEKAGCYVNADGRLQYAEAALPPRDGSLPDLDLFAILLGRPRRPGPVARRPGRAGRGDPGLRGRRRAACCPSSASSLGERRATNGEAAASPVRRPLDDPAVPQGGPPGRADAEGRRGRLSGDGRRTSARDRSARQASEGELDGLGVIGISVKILIVVGITQGTVAYLILVERKIAA